MKLDIQIIGHTKDDIVKALEEALRHYKHNDISRHEIQIDMTKTQGKASAYLVQNGEPVKEYALVVRGQPFKSENEVGNQRFSTLLEVVANCQHGQEVAAVGIHGSFMHIVL